MQEMAIATCFWQFPVWHILRHWKWRQYLPPKCWQLLPDCKAPVLPEQVTTQTCLDCQQFPHSQTSSITDAEIRVGLHEKCSLLSEFNRNWTVLWHLLKARTVEPEKPPLLGNGCVTRNNGVTVGIGVFCARIYDENHLSLRDCLETAGRRVGGWSEMVASLRGREPGRRGTSTLGSRYQTAQWKSWLRTVSLYDCDL
jgi:hypothetical protein